jgi:hypothetical protein
MDPTTDPSFEEKNLTSGFRSTNYKRTLSCRQIHKILHNFTISNINRQIIGLRRLKTSWYTLFLAFTYILEFDAHVHMPFLPPLLHTHGVECTHLRIFGLVSGKMSKFGVKIIEI